MSNYKGFISAGLLILAVVVMLWPASISDYGGAAQAQTGPPADTATLIPTATPTGGVTNTPTPTFTPISGTATSTPTPTITGTLPTSTPEVVATAIQIIIDIDIDNDNDNSSTTNPGSGGDGNNDIIRTILATVERGGAPTPTFTPLPTRAPITATATAERVVIPIATSDTTNTPDTPTATATATPLPQEPVAAATPTPAPLLVDAVPIDPNTVPTGIAPLDGMGGFYRIDPAPEGTFARLITNFGYPGCDWTLIIPTSPLTTKIVRLEVGLAQLDAITTPFPNFISPLAAFNLRVYGTTNGIIDLELTQHDPPIGFVTCPLDLPPENKGVLLRYEPAVQAYQYPHQEYDPVSRILRGYLSQTSLFVAGSLLETQLMQTTTSTTTLTTTPDESSGLPWWIFWAILLGFLGVIALFLLLGGGPALMGLFAPAPAQPQETMKPNGLVLAFANDGPPTQVRLAELPTLAQAVPTSTPLALIWVPDAGSEIPVYPVRPGMLKQGRALTLTNGTSLVSWNGYDLSRLAGMVVTGCVNWQQSESMFARLHQLQPEQPLEIFANNNDHYNYTIDSITTYQATDNLIIEPTVLAPNPQLIFITWSELYDIDQQPYRDFLVLQASQREIIVETPDASSVAAV